ncbi:MAG: hypothetical protein LBE35_09445 [Clostridiales bacterium]|jgi:hypothetical protein|nr:hypothetical protein [Clostridiales bacterium]
MLCERKLREGLNRKAAAYELAQEYAKEVLKHFKPYAIMLYGSYYDGLPGEWDEINIAIAMNNYEGNRFEDASKLSSLVNNISFYIKPRLIASSNGRTNSEARQILENCEILYHSEREVLA